MGAESERPLNGTQAVFVDSALLLRDRRTVVIGFLLGAEFPSVEIGNAFFEHPGVASGLDIPTHGQRQPEQIIGTPGANTTTGGRMPPVLHVPLLELPARRPQDLLAEQFRRGMHQSHGILKLIAETVRAARLIEGRARPHPAGKRLIEQPAVDQSIDGWIGGFYLNAPQPVTPGGVHLCECGRSPLYAAKAHHKLLGNAEALRSTAGENHRPAFPIFEFDACLQRNAGIPPRPQATGEVGAIQCGGLLERPIPADKFSAIASDRIERFAAVEKSDVRWKVRAVGISRHDRPGERIALRDNIHLRAGAQFPKHEFPIGGERQFSRPAGGVGKRQPHHFHRIIGSDEHAEFRGHFRLTMQKRGVSKTMMYLIASGPRGRIRRWRPVNPGFLIADEDRLAAGITDRIIGPGSESVFVAVVDPRKGTSRFRDNRADPRIGDHIHPWGGGRLAGPQPDVIFATIFAESTPSVKCVEIGGRSVGERVR